MVTSATSSKQPVAGVAAKKLALASRFSTRSSQSLQLCTSAALQPQVITVLLAVRLTAAKPSTPLQGAPTLSVALLEKL